ncbi:hypothetical protein, partial [Stenotrophomonas muris]|uniref:hypothetical protein n=1 Tax=Stenotrophomonas muris TaxID=2963283 RepID=UPI00383B4684
RRACPGRWSSGSWPARLDAAGIELASRWLCSSTPNPRPACGARRGPAPENLYRSQGPPAAVE